MTELAPKLRLSLWNFSLTWLRISGPSLNTAHQISQKKHVPARTWPRRRQQIHTLQDPSSRCASTLHPSSPSVHTHASFQSLWKWFILTSSVFTLSKAPFAAGDASSATTLHSQGVFSSQVEGSRTSAVAKLTFLLHLPHFYSMCYSLNKTSHQMLPWEQVKRSQKETGADRLHLSHVVSITAPLDRGSKRAKTVENCLIVAKICR